MRNALLPAALVLLTASLGGCVKKTLTIDSQPAGALVVINDVEVGRTPVTVPFTWYGNYEIILSKVGFETKVISQTVSAPPHQWLGVDLITECLLPFEFTDEQSFSYTLDEMAPVDRAALIERGEALQQQALRGG
jgi:hypothetical protein